MRDVFCQRLCFLRLRTALRGWVALVCTGIGALFLHAQEPSPPVEAPVPVHLRTLQSLLEARENIEEHLQTLKGDLEPGTPDAVREAAQKQATEWQARLEENKRQFQELAAGRVADGFGPEQPRDFDLSREIFDLAKPAVEAAKSATERPRRLEQLRAGLARARERAEEARRAGLRAEARLSDVPAGAAYDGLRRQLSTLITQWRDREREAQAQAESMQLQLAELDGESRSLWETITHALKTFLLTRGRNLALAVLAALGVFLLMRWLHRAVVRSLPFFRGKNRPFVARLAEVTWLAFSAVGTVLAGLVVLYLAGDWLLLGLALIILLSLGLVAKNALPRYYQQARLLLNIGPVREGERVVLGGVPWRVRTIHLSSWLENPALGGQGLRLPLDQLQTMTSRPFDEKEPWFPCTEGDWVQLVDGTLGKVVHLTPEFVQLVMLGGGRKTYPTSGFVTQHAVNLSGGFRLSSTFGVDYRHQAIALTEVPAALETSVLAGLLRVIDKDHVRNVQVAFARAGESALEYEIIVDFAGAVAERSRLLQRLLQRQALETCQQHGWTVPFPQLVVHGGPMPA